PAETRRDQGLELVPQPSVVGEDQRRELAVRPRRNEALHLDHSPEPSRVHRTRPIHLPYTRKDIRLSSTVAGLCRNDLSLAVVGGGGGGPSQAADWPRREGRTA